MQASNQIKESNSGIGGRNQYFGKEEQYHKGQTTMPTSDVDVVVGGLSQQGFDLLLLCRLHVRGAIRRCARLGGSLKCGWWPTGVWSWIPSRRGTWHRRCAPPRWQPAGGRCHACLQSRCLPPKQFYVIFCHFWADGELSEPIFHLWDEVLEDFELAVVTCIMQRKTSIYCSVDIDSLVSRRTFMKVEWQWNIKWLLCTSPKEKVPTLHIQKEREKKYLPCTSKKEREKVVTLHLQKKSKSSYLALHQLLNLVHVPILDCPSQVTHICSGKKTLN